MVTQYHYGLGPAISDIFVLFLQDYCALQELLTKMNFMLAVAPPFVHPMMSLLAMPTHSIRKYGFLVNLLGGDKWQNRQLKTL